MIGYLLHVSQPWLGPRKSLQLRYVPLTGNEPWANAPTEPYWLGLISQLLNSCYFYLQWVTRKMMNNFLFSKHFLGFVDTCFSIAAFSSKGESFTLTLLWPLDLDDYRHFVAPYGCYQTISPLSFLKTPCFNFMPLEYTDHCQLLFHLSLPPLSFV